MDQHDLVAGVKDLALELGRTPTRAEFESRTKGGAYQLTKLFGSFSALLQAAGLDTYDTRRSGHKEKTPKIDNRIFERDIHTHLASYEPKAPRVEPDRFQHSLFIGDFHAPFADMRLVEKITRYAEKRQPEVIVQGGDLYDMFSAGKFPRSHNIFTPREEQAAGRKQAETFWSEMRKACPKARLVQLCGNHDIRPLKRVLESFPVGEDWIARAIQELMTFEGVELIEDYRQELILPGNVMVHHGYLSGLGKHRDYNVGFNTVVFHTHSGGVAFRKINGVIRWELNGGFVGDVESKGFTYTPQRNLHWTQGVGEIDEYGPRFIPGGCL